MHSTAGRTAVDEGPQDKSGPAALTTGGQAATGNRSPAQSAAMSPGNEFNQFTPFGVRSAAAGVTESTFAICHSLRSFDEQVRQPPVIPVTVAAGPN